mmetsp:Transcript_895/g.2346  ORF Transcript_895/g.2346 Transcript_895/m.2346 type:complete len:145 (-) Transcript_895:383-817(-)
MISARNLQHTNTSFDTTNDKVSSHFVVLFSESDKILGCGSMKMTTLTSNHDGHIPKCLSNLRSWSIKFKSVSTLHNLVTELAENLTSVVDFPFTTLSWKKFVRNTSSRLARLRNLNILDPESDCWSLREICLAFFSDFLNVDKI